MEAKQQFISQFSNTLLSKPCIYTLQWGFIYHINLMGVLEGG